MEECRSQSYEGAGNMAGAKKWMYCHNTESVPQSSLLLLHESRFKLGCIKIMQANRNAAWVMLDSVKQVGLFFQYSPKKQHCLEKVVDEVNQKRKPEWDVGGRGTRLINITKVNTLCYTRWVEMHAALQDLVIMFEHITECLSLEETTGMPSQWLRPMVY